jgi:peptidoglycan/LPS O-acetylase OafA/YrhL
MNEPPRQETSRFFTPLESLRGLAALSVVVFHAVWTNPITSLRFFQNGPLMVDFFFVLSGFVICHSYGPRLRTFQDVLCFMWLRLGRLYPLHLAFLLVFLGFEVAKLVVQTKLGIIADKPAFTVNDGYSFLTNLLLIQSLGLHKSLTYNYPSWSISTEFYTYLVFAAARTLISSDRLFALVSLVIVGASTALLLAVGIVSLADAGYDVGFFRCTAGFFIGVLVCCIYYATRRADAPRAPSWLGALSFVALVLTVVFLSLIDPAGRGTYFMPLLSAAVVLTIVLWPSRRVSAALSIAPLQWLGRVSYSLYMTHAALVWIITQFLTVIFKFPKIELEDGHGVATPALTGVVILLLYVVAVMLLSQVTFRFIEAPLRRRSRVLASKWFDTKAAPSAAPARG